MKMPRHAAKRAIETIGKKLISWFTEMPRHQSVHLRAAKRAMETIQGKYEFPEPPHFVKDMERCVVRACRWQAQLGIGAAVTKALDELLEKYELDLDFVRDVKTIVCSLYLGDQSSLAESAAESAQLMPPAESTPLTQSMPSAESVPSAQSAPQSAPPAKPTVVPDLHYGVSKFLTKTYYETCFNDQEPTCVICWEPIASQKFSLLQCGHYHCISCTRRLIHCSQCRELISVPAIST